MLRMLRRVVRREEGATIIEFAIVLPVFLLVLLGIIEFSLIMFVSSVIEGATSAAARMSKTGLARSGDPDVAVQSSEDMAMIRQVIMDRGFDILKPENLTVVVSPSQSAANTMGGSGETVVYETTYRWELMTPIVASIIAPDDGIMTLSSQVVVVNEPFEDDPVNQATP